jgi:hypothetical protein
MTLRMPDYSQDSFALYPWSAIATVSAGIKVCVDGLVYNNLTGGNSNTLPALNGTDWVLEAQSTSFYITKKYGNVQIKITNFIEVSYFTDLATNTVYNGTDLIYKKLDSTGNIINCQSSSTYCRIGFLNRLEGNSTDVCLDGASEIIIPIGGVSTVSRISLKNSVIDFGNYYSYNNFLDVNLTNTRLVFPNGTTGAEGLMISFAEDTTINCGEGLSVLRGNVNNQGSNIEHSNIIPNSSTLDLDTFCNGYSDVFGVFQLRGNSPNVDTIVRACRLFPIKLYPYGGNTLGITKTAPNAATTGKIISQNDFTLLSNNADYVILEPITINVGGGDVDVWQVKEYKNNT